MHTYAVERVYALTRRRDHQTFNGVIVCVFVTVFCYIRLLWGPSNEWPNCYWICRSLPFCKSDIQHSDCHSWYSGRWSAATGYRCMELIKFEVRWLVSAPRLRLTAAGFGPGSRWELFTDCEAKRSAGSRNTIASIGGE